MSADIIAKDGYNMATNAWKKFHLVCTFYTQACM